MMQKERPSERQIDILAARSAPRVYAQAIQIEASPEEVQLVLCHKMVVPKPDSDDTIEMLIPQVFCIMTVAHAERLLGLFTTVMSDLKRDLAADASGAQTEKK